jgi:flagellar biosynthesis/type III secretory pathway chaperone
MHVFKSKKDIDKQIRRNQHNYDCATYYFEKKFDLTHEQAGAEVAQLDRIVAEKSRLQAEFQDKLKPLIDEQNHVIFEYQKQSLLAQISHDRQKIFDRLAELERESRPPKPSAQYIIMRERNTRLLDSVSERNFERILNEVTPEQRKMLTKLWEHERDKVRGYVRTCGR